MTPLSVLEVCSSILGPFKIRLIQCRHRSDILSEMEAVLPRRHAAEMGSLLVTRCSVISQTNQKVPVQNINEDFLNIKRIIL